MKRKNLIILVGNIGSGKSTLTNKYVKKGYVAISRDGLRYSIGGGKYIFNVKYEPLIYRVEQEMFEQFCGHGVNLIIDEVNVTKKLRKKYIETAKFFGYKITAIKFPKVPRKDAITRRLINNHGSTSRRTWNRVWDMFESSYENPTKREGFDKIIELKKKDVGL